MNWKIKGVTQKVLSTLPGGIALNTRLQTILGEQRNLDALVEVKLHDWTLSMKYLAESGISVIAARMMEIGTGWYPVLPICFLLAGADSVVTFDIVPHLTDSGLCKLLSAMEKRIPFIAEATDQSPETIVGRFAPLLRLQSRAALLQHRRIEYHAPADARSTGLESNSIDIVYSNSVLEHVPRETIAQLMNESYRVLKNGGVVMHNVACNDHYANFDKSISHVNFLRFDEHEWRFWNNSLQYQNRLRASEFLQLAHDGGFQIAAQRTHVRPGTLQALRDMQIALEFRSFSEADLVTTTVDFIARKPVQEFSVS